MNTTTPLLPTRRLDDPVRMLVTGSRSGRPSAMAVDVVDYCHPPRTRRTPAEIAAELGLGE